jgi:hypothetical protein
VACKPARESRNTQPVEVRFRASLGEEPEVEVRPWRVYRAGGGNGRPDRREGPRVSRA